MGTLTADPAKMEALLHKMVVEMGAASSGALVVLGDRLGLYRAMAEAGRVTPASLAERSGTHERYVREWLANQAASGYVSYADGEFWLSPEQAAVFADEDSPFLMTGGYWSLGTLYVDEEKIARAFRSGEGVAWGDHHPHLYHGVEKFFRPTYRGQLLQQWIPALDGVQEKLRAGGRFADVGCGFGTSTRLLAAAFPASEFTGYDSHPASIERARKAAAEEGLSNVRFELAHAKDYPGRGFDVIAFFDCLHDMGDPKGAVEHARTAVKPDGCLMVVEPAAGDRLEDNLNPVGRLYYAFSTFVCTPSSLSQEVAAGLGAQAGGAALGGLLRSGGFSRVRRAAATPFNLILEARI